MIQRSLQAVWRAPCVHLIRLLSFLVTASGSASVIVYVFLGGRPQAWTFPAALSLGLILLGVVACLASFRHDGQEAEEALEKAETGECICIWASLRFGSIGSVTPEFRQVCVRQAEKIEWEAGDVVTRLGASDPATDKTCICCLEDYQPNNQIALLPCGHVFHEECLACWSVSSAAAGRCCPTCRKSYSMGDV
ncbi:Rnf103 [Symbiodinium microadriaticum]|nr:Rnf103 [Symbiodinium sp. KB8]CAE7618716.1 Rnf103 [Symbiodinium microadriaticum]